MFGAISFAKGAGRKLKSMFKGKKGKGSRYMETFKANEPMLSHPDKIYVGQMLRTPADAKFAST